MTEIASVFLFGLVARLEATWLALSVIAIGWAATALFGLLLVHGAAGNGVAQVLLVLVTFSAPAFAAYSALAAAASPRGRARRHFIVAAVIAAVSTASSGWRLVR